MQGDALELGMGKRGKERERARERERETERALSLSPSRARALALSLSLALSLVPDPVEAMPMRSRPWQQTGQHCAWMHVGLSNPFTDCREVFRGQGLGTELFRDWGPRFRG